MSPRHIAIIMDGNGRWAKKQGFLKRMKGHEAGASVVREITSFCAGRGVECLTLYAFSTENWQRPKEEVEFLMNMLGSFLKRELETYHQNNIRFETIGDLSRLSPALVRQIQATKEATRQNSGLRQVLAINYGAQDEITRAVQKILASGASPSADTIAANLDTAALPPLDMLVRTGGELRLSNFLLWQAAYAELFFTPTLWPDFTAAELEEMMNNFALRSRRWGKV